MLLVTVIDMGFATVGIGLLPSTALTGLLAPVLLVTLRLVQGFFTGGKVIGAAAFVAELAPQGRRSLFGVSDAVFSAGHCSSYRPGDAAPGAGNLQGSAAVTSAELPSQIAWGEWATPTAGVLDDYRKSNLVIVPQDQAYALLLFCLRNAKACPILAVGNAGDPRVPLPGAAIDIRTMLPRYRVWQHGHLVAEPTDIETYWGGFSAHPAGM